MIQDIPLKDIQKILDGRIFQRFALKMNPKLKLEPFHETYYKVLEEFANGKIKNLIVSMPTQHGKSEGSTRILPAFMLGHNPDLKIVVASYAAKLAQGFNRDVQANIESLPYHEIFPKTILPRSEKSKASSTYVKNAHEFNCVNHTGGLVATGRGGGISGVTVDVLIYDDLYKDAAEGNSPTIRQAVIDWYTSVADKRLHNNSQQLITFTRWHEDDLIGFLEENDFVVSCSSWKEVEEALKRDPDVWIKVNFQAIKDGAPTEFDPRENGLALWEVRHGLKKHLLQRKRNEHEFECMSQGNPDSKEGRLYGEFQTYQSIGSPVLSRGNYTDTADEGDNYLASISYDKCVDGLIYLTDVTYTQDPMEKTEISVAMMLDRADTRLARIESNNGGRGFSRAVIKNLKEMHCDCKVIWFHQSENKESRIITNNNQVTETIRFPHDWETRWPEFARHLIQYKRKFSANKYDDAQDALTGVYEKERIKKKRRGVKIR